MIYIHSTPKAVAPHVEWSISRALGEPVRIDWIDQPVTPGQQRGELFWHGKTGAGADIASALVGWQTIRFEITEEPQQGLEGYRWAYTPTLGMFSCQIDWAGNLLINEFRLRSALESAGSNALELQREMRKLLGQSWDDELEVFRKAGMDAPVVWLQRFG
ncbi:MAG: hypothetical protein RLZ88_699 [Actinomycetota bacterium]